jgi:anti-sigma B factor antagonist
MGYSIMNTVRQAPRTADLASAGRRRAEPVDCVMRTLLFQRRTSHASPHDTALDAGEISIQVVRASSESTVIVTGRVTVDSSPHLRSVLLQLLRRGAGPAVVIDLSGVSYLDMSGLATLLEALKAAHQRAVRLRVLGMTGQSRMLAEIAELDKVFQAAGSEVEFR